MARFIPEIEAIKKLLIDKGLRFSIITGEIKNKANEIAKFQNDTDVLVFVGQIATAGLGITLMAASTMVFYSLDYSMSNFEQAKARIHRTGQKEGIYTLDFKGELLITIINSLAQEESRSISENVNFKK